MQAFSYLLFGALAVSADPYGDIKDVKLKEPADAQNVASTPPPAGAIVLFDGKNVHQWVKRKDATSPAEWQLVNGNAMQVNRTGDIMTRRDFGGRFKLHVEFRVPYLPLAKGQARGNSGVYVQGRYEVQILDSYGLDSKDDDCGAIYKVARPTVNVCKAPTVWQSYDIEFTSPRCENGKKAAPGRMTVVHNGRTIHNAQELTADNTRGGMGGHPCTPGPILLQDHGNPVQFRNIWLLPLPFSEKRSN